jgi:hypothetical protein
VNRASLLRVLALVLIVPGVTVMAQVEGDFGGAGSRSAAACDPICSPGPCFSLQAVAVNGISITPANCVDVQPGDLIDAEIMVSNWASVLPLGVEIFQATLDGITTNVFGPGGTILPLGWDAPVFPIIRCWGPADCPTGYPYCYGRTSYYQGVCRGPNHNPRIGFFMDMGRPDFLFKDRIAVQSFTATEALNYYVAVVVLDREDPRGGVRDGGVPRYAASLRLVASKDACGTFTYGFSIYQPGLQVIDDLDFRNERGSITLHDLSINVDCDCNNDGIRDLEAIAAGTSKDCNGNGRPDDCDIANGSADVNGDGIPDHCKRDRVRDMDE